MPISKDVILGKDVQIFHPELVNLYGCTIGDHTKIGTFVEIQKGVSVGAKCKVSSHSFLCEGVVIEDDVFIGHGVMFINDRYPRSTANGKLKDAADWNVTTTLIKKGASLSSGAVIMCGVTIGEQAIVGAGAVVTKNVENFAIVVGVPAKKISDVRERG